MSDKLSRDEKGTFIELLETTVPFAQKVISLMGKENYAKFIRIRNDWKRRLDLFYTDVANYDGCYAAIYLENMLSLIEEYHEEANARYGEIIKNEPEMITRLLAGTQSVNIKRITEDTILIDPKDVEYLELSKNTVFAARTRAISIYESGDVWKPKGDEARGPVFVSQIFFMLEALDYAKTYYLKSLKYHSIRHADPDKYQEYWNFFTNYILSTDGKQPVPFKLTIQTFGEKILDHLQSIYPEVIHYVKLSEALDEDKDKISYQLSRLLKKDLIEKIERGIYKFKDKTAQYINIEEDIEKPIVEEKAVVLDTSEKTKKEQKEVDDIFADISGIEAKEEKPIVEDKPIMEKKPLRKILRRILRRKR